VFSPSLQCPALPLAWLLARSSERYGVEKGEEKGPAAQENSSRTVCYHFATQLGSTGRHKMNQPPLQSSKYLNKIALYETGRYRTKRCPANARYCFKLFLPLVPANAHTR
jgi:hypothetical protein